MGWKIQAEKYTSGLNIYLKRLFEKVNHRTTHEMNALAIFMIA